MVDFRKRLGKSGGAKPVDPVELYEGLDRASDKGPLRPAQLAVLKEWHAERRNQRIEATRPLRPPARMPSCAAVALFAGS